MSVSGPSLVRFAVTFLATLAVAFGAMKRIVGYLPMDYRLLLSGYLPEYVYRVGGLDQRYPMSDLRTLGRITDRAKKADRSDSFSADIRRGVPGYP